MNVKQYNEARAYVATVLTQVEALERNPEHVALMQRLARESAERHARWSK